MTASAAPAAYASAWRGYRLWRVAFWLLFLGFLPAMNLAWGLLRASGHGGLLALAALAWMIAFAVAGYRVSNFSCPRCGELFFRRFDPRPWRQDWQYNPFARRCMHCGLPKGSLADPGPGGTR